MDRARRVGLTALILVALTAPAGGPGATPASAAPVGWPISSLVVSEVQTGGSSASDEFVEIANQGALSVDLAGLELVYATASGSTVTRKAAWDISTVLSPGRRLLVANGSGVHAAIADTVYSGGFAATGGAVALRLISGAVVDSVGWGDATSGFVEGVVAPAPPAGSSLERRPGGVAGNGTDTNDNAADWFVEGVPSPQGLGAPPVPSGSPTPVATPTPTGSPTPVATPTPAGSPTPGATPSPTPGPTPSPVPSPVPTPTPTPTPAPTATPTPTPSPDQTPIPIATVRALADGSPVMVEGVLTTSLGALESGRGGFVQDSTGGIALYLDAVVSGSWSAGTAVTLTGTLSSRFAQRTLRLAEAAISRAGTAELPVAVPVAIVEANEAREGTRVSVTGTVAGAPDALADGTGITLDDGTGSIRAVIGIDAEAGLTIASGMIATVSGPLGQRDSSGTGSSGYRVHATLGGELALAEPTPSPTPTPSPSPTPTPTPTPTGTPDATPTPPASQPLIVVRGMAVGTAVTIDGVVTAEAGRLGTPALIAVADDTAGIAVRLPNGAAGFARGTWLRITGTLAAPYGQLEIKAAASGLEQLGTAELPTPLPAGPAPLDESSEGSLVSVTGTIVTKPKHSSGGDLTLVLERPGAASLKVIADASSQVAAGAFTVGATYRVTGVVGQRASRKGALDGYRVCLRDLADVVVVAGFAAGTQGSSLQRGSSGPGSADASSSTPIARVLGRIGETVTIAGVVTAPPQLLDATRRRIVVQDESSGIEVLLPSGTEAPPVGTRVQVRGEVGVAYGAPRIRADDTLVLTGGRPISPKAIRGAPGRALEWQLVSIAGRIDDVHKLGERWRAEMLVGGARVVVVGQPGSAIAVTGVVEGRMARVTGIVRRPFPTASDQRYAILPRGAADLDILGAAPPSSSSGGAAASGQRPGPSGPSVGRGRGEAPDGIVDADLIDLETLTGREVRVGGLVVDLRPDGLLLDDGTTTGIVVLREEALAFLPLLEPDDAINAIGHVERLPDGFAVVVDAPGGIIQAGDPVAPDAGASSPDAQLSTDPAAQGPFQSVPPVSRAGLLDTAPGLGAGLVGLGTLLALSGASLAITLGRRARTRRRLEARVAARVAALGEPSGPRSSPRSAEHAGGAFR